MTFLPIVDRELRAAARRHGTFSARLGIALVAIVVGVIFYVANARTPRQFLAHRIFEGLSGLALLYCLVSGRRLTADCLSEEKREGTLGLLFLTDLKGYDVVLGKLAATSLNGFFGLLAIFPVMAVPLLIGGITNGEFWRMALVLVDTFLCSLAIGVLASVLSWDARRAMGANFLWLLLIVAALPACAGAIWYFSPWHPFVQSLFYTCPIYTFYLAFDSNYKWNAPHFWWSALVIHALTWLILSIASGRAPHSWQDNPPEEGHLRWSERWQLWLYGSPQRRKALRLRLLAVNPFYWLAARAWFKPAGVWAALGFVAGWWAFVRWVLKFPWFEESFCFATALILNSLLKLWVGVEAGRQLAEDQKAGALELLLSTPIGAGDILRGQWLALRRQFLGPFLVVVAVQLVLIAMAPGQSFQVDSKARAFGLGGLALLVVDLAALFWLAMANALTARTPNQAVVATITRLLFLPSVFGIAIMAVAEIWLLARSNTGPNWKFTLIVWLGLGLAADSVYGWHAWRQVRTKFRELALKRTLRGYRQTQSPLEAGPASSPPVSILPPSSTSFQPTE